MAQNQADVDTPADWVEDSDIQHTGAKQNGNDAETWVQQAYELAGQDTDICPSHAHDVVDPRTGTPGEVKSCQIRYNGEGKRGRFQIWDYAHQDLLDRNGFYVFVVHEPRSDQFHVYLHRPLPASTVDELITNWLDQDHRLRPDHAKKANLYQSDIFSDIGITRIDQEEQHEADFQPGESVDAERKPQAERVQKTKDTIGQIEEQGGEDLAPHGAVIAALRSEGIEEEQAEHQISELKKRGEIYEPQEGQYRVT